jgi:predicted dinucleotide-binding enzyme
VTTAVIGTGGVGSVSAVDNRDALRGADAVVLALRFGVLKGVIGEIADPLAGKLVVVPSNPVGIDARGNVSRLLPKGQSSGEVVAGWLPAGARLAMAFGTLSADLFASSSNRSPEPAVLFYATDDDHAGEEVERLIRTAGFEPVKAGGIGQSGRRRSRRGAVIDRRGLTASPACLGLVGRPARDPLPRRDPRAWLS